MSLSKISSMPTLQQKIKHIGIALAIVGFLGFLDASYLSIEHYLGKTVECSVSIFSDCGTVTTSVYSKILGIPVAYLGALYYLSIIALGILLIDTKNSKLAKYAGLYTILGLLASIYFVFLQAFVLEAFCLYCMLSAASSTILFLIGMRMLQLLRNEKRAPLERA